MLFRYLSSSNFYNEKWSEPSHQRIKRAHTSIYESGVARDVDHFSERKVEQQHQEPLAPEPTSNIDGKNVIEQIFLRWSVY